MSQAPDSGRLRILIVDDNVEGGQLLRALLAQRGHDVTVAVSGEEALRVAKDFLPHIGLLDIGMPDMDGYALAEHFRHDPLHSSMFLVAVTGWAQEEDKRRAIEAGFDAHVTKPADPDELNQLLLRHVPLASTERCG